MIWSPDEERARLGRGLAPDWADQWGEDRFGVFAVFVIEGVAQRMRWIRPGSFMMGSPEDEAGRSPGELLHEVRLTTGFWIADTPCTQALWQAVMGADQNPSEFKSPLRPVEQVSWEDVAEFVKHLNLFRPELNVELPTEAQWEYACRAGTSTATYAGSMEVLEGGNDSILDGIAWYWGNSGVGGELENGTESSMWSEKQHSIKRAGTRDVGLKQPNVWGLYDMLGNVWEWCADWYGAYEPKCNENPSSPPSGQNRVTRGGSWLANPHDVRAACRFPNEPRRRSAYLGFRLVRSRSSVVSANQVKETEKS